MTPHVRVDSHTLWWYIAFPVASAIGINVLAYLVVKVWQYPPEEARSFLGHALVGVALSLPYGLMARWWMRRHRAEYIRVSRMTYIEAIANLMGLRLAWPGLAFVMVLVVARAVIWTVHDLPSRSLDGPLLLLNLLWGFPIAAHEAARIRKEAFGGT